MSGRYSGMPYARSSTTTYVLYLFTFDEQLLVL